MNDNLLSPLFVTADTGELSLTLNQEGPSWVNESKEVFKDAKASTNVNNATNWSAECDRTHIWKARSSNPGNRSAFLRFPASFLHVCKTVSWWLPKHVGALFYLTDSFRHFLSARLSYKTNLTHLSPTRAKEMRNKVTSDVGQLK
jgi:hypothetical protein